MPYSMIEPLREVLDSGMHRAIASKQDDRWSQTLKHESVTHRLKCAHCSTHDHYARGSDEHEGRRRPVDGFQRLSHAACRGLPMFRGTYGMSRGQQP